MPAITKLSKKQQKAAQFKKGELKKSEKPVEEVKEVAPKPQPAKKPAAKKFILFVGNLPYDLEADELKEHFSSASPSLVRMRNGFAFVEFDNSENLNTALRFHHSTLKYRKINVELTAGGGGNSKNRRAKLDKKNKALQTELTERIEQEKKKKESEKAGKEGAKKEKKEGMKEEDLSMIHPSRRKNFM